MTTCAELMFWTALQTQQISLEYDQQCDSLILAVRVATLCLLDAEDDSVQQRHVVQFDLLVLSLGLCVLMNPSIAKITSAYGPHNL